MPIVDQSTTTPREVAAFGSHETAFVRLEARVSLLA